MSSRTASCCCGQLSIELQGRMLGGGICHCFACQRRTGSVFATLAAFGAPYGFVMVAVGAFADPDFPAPEDSVYDSRRHRWVQLPPGIKVFDKNPS